MSISYLSLRNHFRLAVVVIIAGAAVFGLPIAGVCYLKLGYLRLICPVGFLEICLATRSLNWTLLPAALTVMLILFLLGRFFCAWLCPAAYLGEKLQRLAIKVTPRPAADAARTWWHRLAPLMPRLDYGDAIALLLGSFAGILIFGYPFISTFCSIGVVSRSIISLFTHFRLRYDLVLIIPPVLLGLLFVRGWKSCCPAGAFRGLSAGLNRTFVPVVNQSLCTGCGLCEKACPLGIGPQLQRIDTRRCYKCLQCLDACPKNAISLALLQPRILGPPLVSGKGNTPATY